VATSFFSKRKKIESELDVQVSIFLAEFCQDRARNTLRESKQDMVTRYKDAIEDRQREGNATHQGGFAPPFRSGSGSTREVDP
jgi:hypothetical protein